MPFLIGLFSPVFTQCMRSFKVRKMNRRFKNFLTVNMAVGSAIMAGDRGTYGDKMPILSAF